MFQSLIFLVVLFPTLSFSSNTSWNGGHDDSTCEPGVLLPVWQPQKDLTSNARFLRGLVYFTALLYTFIGVFFASNRFMAAIDVITSKQKEVRIKLANGDEERVHVHIWNETVANLTLVALGSSAPEILLLLIDTFSTNFGSGERGLATIIGSAAFNLLVTTAICVSVIPQGEVRRIKHPRVFFLMAIWSLFAFLWLLYVLKVRSPGVVEFKEGLITLLFFPATVLTAYFVDRRVYRWIINPYGDRVDEMSDGNGLRNQISEDEVKDIEKSRRDFTQVLHELRMKYPEIDLDQLEGLARKQLLKKGHKSRAFYRMQATHKFAGGQSILNKLKEKKANLKKSRGKMEDAYLTKIYFQQSHYTVVENVGKLKVTLCREGGDRFLSVLVDYKTLDSSASAGKDFVEDEGTILFSSEEMERPLTLKIIDNDNYEGDREFFVQLTNPRFPEYDTLYPITVKIGKPPRLPEVCLRPSMCFVKVSILDNDHCGVFTLDEKEVDTMESIGRYEVKVYRYVGARGRVAIPYETEEGTAKEGKHYVHVQGELIFENNETEKSIFVEVLEEDVYKKVAFFYVCISEPILLDPTEAQLAAFAMRNKPESELTAAEKIAVQGLPQLGSEDRCEMRVHENKEFKDTVDHLLQGRDASSLVGTSSWMEQFTEAFTVSPELDEEGEKEKKPTCGDYFLHLVTLFWKITFAFVPPTDICNGYLAFLVSIIGIGVLTALIGDLASHLGCTVGLKDSVTAITFIALGTSVPDAFVNRVAAIQDDSADSSLGNVLGRNTVNVFLGIGLAWTISTFYHEYIKDCVRIQNLGYVCGMFHVDPGSLGYSILLLCGCALVAIPVLLIRRLPNFGGGELGGPAMFKFLTSALFISLWGLYVTLSTLEAYGLIEGF